MTEPPDLPAVATALRRAGYSAYVLTLTGQQITRSEASYKRMKDPRPGDWVLEISTVYRSRGTSDLDAVGVLEEKTSEPVHFSDPEFVWDEKEEGRPHPTETVFYIRTLDGRRFRWINAEFVAILMEDPLKGTA